MIFGTVVLSFPNDPGPTPQDMNYTALVIGGWIFLCLAYYFFPVYGGMYWFKGPVSNLKATVEDSSSSVNVEEKEISVRTK